MVAIACSSCGKNFDADTSYAGKRVLCPHCKAEVSIPVLEGAFKEGSPQAYLTQTLSSDSPNVANTLAIRALLGIALVLILVTIGGFLVAWFRNAMDTAQRSHSINNLKQIGLAMQSFHDTNKRLPFNGIAAGRKFTPPNSKITYFGNATTDCASSGSWAFQILPFLDSEPFSHLTGVPDSDEVPAKYKNTGVSTFMCPGRGRRAWIADAGPWSDYHINIVLNSSEQDGKLVIGFEVPDIKRTLLGIQDGTSSTIFAGHGYMNRDAYGETTSQGNFSSVIWVGGTEGTGRAFGVRAPEKLTPTFGPAARLLRDDWQRNTGITSETTPQPWGGPFAEGALFVFCDGTVRLMTYTKVQEESRQGFGGYFTPSNQEMPDWGPD